MGVDNLVDLWCHGRFYKGDVSQCCQYLFSKGIICLFITIIGRARTICDKVFFKLRVSFDGPVIRKKLLSDSIHRIEIHLNMVV